MFGVAVEIWVIAGLSVVATLFLMSMLARLYRKAGPHQALVVYGFRGTRVVKGHGTIIFPMIETCRDLSLELIDRARLELPEEIRQRLPEELRMKITGT